MSNFRGLKSFIFKHSVVILSYDIYYLMHICLSFAFFRFYICVCMPLAMNYMNNYIHNYCDLLSYLLCDADRQRIYFVFRTAF